ncbi:amino acid ABC transporter permease/ATP-binding protein [Castellaniella sp.]|uniref:amino acid ABC transporter permease/ATP-binding protein n=1 Tax=Castellaniella sp. TaxID=1955812 RepID=UPI0035601B21
MSFDWDYTFSLLWDTDFWMACWTVIELSIASWVIAGLFGFFLALAKQSSHRWLNRLSRVYIWFFRSLPLLVLLVFTYNFPQVLPQSSVVLSNPFYAGLIALILSEAAYMAEIHRGGILSVPVGQYEAGRALGVSYFGIQWHIVIPQAIRIALPTLSNEFVTIVKLTSLVSVISLAEILLVGQRLYTQNFLIFETMVAVAFYYVLIVTVFDKGLVYLDGRLDISKRKHKALVLAPGEQARLEGLREKIRTASGPQEQSQTGPFVLEGRSLCKSYGTLKAVDDVSLAVRPGEVVSIIGPSGSGKTSVIRTLNGLEKLDSGSVILDGRNFLGEFVPGLPAAQSDQILRIGMVFQSFNLFPHRTALENITMAPGFHKLGDRETLRIEALLLLEKVGLLECANKYPHQLSGGQQQRVAIARALAMRPSIMLFDEPTSALDPELVGEVLKVIEQLAAEGITMVIVTHEMHFAFKVSDRILFMDHGRILHDAAPAELLAVKDGRVGEFLRRIEHG